MSANPITLRLLKGPQANPSSALGRSPTNRAIYNEARAHPEAIHALCVRLGVAREGPEPIVRYAKRRKIRALPDPVVESPAPAEPPSPPTA